ncbi:MAG TPA: DNA internalization-related competence protein ComEC/Rec2 [Limnobacter sp.]|uniref:DNA internalization-related competence protein ComEC/Rec2 n=1 Tax=Limnobacter sp. TaxID=2003368 RepID=UPI002ED958BE
MYRQHSPQFRRLVGAFCCGLWLCSQSPLEWAHAWSNHQSWGVGLWACLLCTAVYGVVTTAGRYRQPLYFKTLAILLACIAGYGWMALDSTATLARRIPLNCHRQDVTTHFQLLELGMRPGGMVRAQVENESPSPCLPKQARLMLRLDQDQTQQLQVGDHYTARLTLRALHPTKNFDGFSIEHHWMQLGLSGFAQVNGNITHLANEHGAWQRLLHWPARLRWTLTEWVVQTLDGHSQQALVLALLTGDQGLIDPEHRTLYANTGIAHLVAISGLHITLFAHLFGALLARLWRLSPRLCLQCPAGLAGLAGGTVMALLYALTSGWQAPAQRTVYMLAMTAWLLCRQAKTNPWDVWFTAAGLCMLASPWCLYDTGFQLSFLAIATLIFSSHGHYRFNSRWPDWLSEPVRAQWAVTVGLLVPSAMLFNQQSLISPLANAIAIPWMSVVSTPLALLGGLGHQAWALHLAAGSLAALESALGWLVEQGPAVLHLHSQPAWILGLAGLGCAGLLMPRHVFPRTLAFALIALMALPPARPAEQTFWVTALDIGQGTAVAVQTRHHALMFDTGPALTPQSDQGRLVLLPWLKAHLNGPLDALWISHSDADHSGGAASVLAQWPIRAFASSLPPDHPLQAAARSNGERYSRTVNTADCHRLPTWEWDGVRFEPLPIRQDDPTDKRWTTNNHSCVLRIHNGVHSVLLTGDVETFAEQKLLEQHPPEALQSEVLFAPHHGSKTSSSPAFLEAVQPTLVIVQSGWHNRYHHPHPSVMARYTGQNLPVLNTAQDGAIRLRFGADTTPPSLETAVQIRAGLGATHENSAYQP